MNMNLMKKRWVKVVVAAVALIIVVVVLVPLFINVDAFRPKAEDEISSSLGRNVTLGHLDLSLITGSLVADNIVVADDPAFAKEPFLEAKELRIGVSLLNLIFQQKVRITSFTVDSPSIHLIQAKNGTWNFSSLGSGAEKPAAEKTAAQKPAKQKAAPPNSAAQEAAAQQGSMLSSVSIGESRSRTGASRSPPNPRPASRSRVRMSTSPSNSFRPQRSFPSNFRSRCRAGDRSNLTERRGRWRRRTCPKHPCRRRYSSSISIRWRRARLSQARGSP